MDSLATILLRVQANVESNFTTQTDFEIKFRQVMGRAYCITCEGNQELSKTSWQDGVPYVFHLGPCPDCTGAHDPNVWARKLQTSGIEPEWETFYHFEKWNDRINPHLMQGFRDVRQWAEAPEGLLLLAGGVGVGKTHLGIATAIRGASMGLYVRYIEASGLLEKMRAAMNTENDSPDRVYESWGTGPRLLVLDDLGFEQHTEYSLSVIENLLSWRLLRNRPTMVTTNTGLEAYSERLRSRLHEKGKVTLVKFDGQDVRVA